MGLSDGRRPSWRVSFLRGEGAPVHCHHHRMAFVCSWPRSGWAVSRSGLAAWLDLDRIRSAGGIEMTRRLLLGMAVFASGVVSAQSLPDVLKNGEEVFAKTCATGYCHGARGSAAGAP